MRVGILGGTFDPVHFGHLHLAKSLAKAHDLNEVWWIPAQINPLKGLSSASSQDRFNMLKLALEEIPNFKILDVEIKRKPPSYTVDTLRTLQAKYPQNTFHFLMGEDLIYQLPKWKEPLEIFRIALPLIGARSSSQFPNDLNLDPQILELCQKGWTSIPLLEISATDVRNRLRNKELCEDVVPTKVLDYIVQHHLY